MAAPGRRPRHLPRIRTMNVFVTIGSQEPFARLLTIVDELALHFPALRFTAQTTPGHPFEARHIETLLFIPPAAFRQHLLDADLVVCHAGIGTILNVLELEKPLIVFPRLARHHETRDDHQVATARAFVQQGYLHMAESSEELRARIEDFLQGKLRGSARIRPFASDGLLESLETFIG
ncbi:glucuronosyltransferase [Flaviaesturariibacter aridisoli]|uniref:Glucuronosyltransferase n=2 Tax=Flaviaesturariibacter aridisoli TaxID=2545761 RepID=A0A4R4E1X9_9BACT|nr:glucuronosyltransferase [Flaviaesturariibacter aridisoli]